MSVALWSWSVHLCAVWGHVREGYGFGTSGSSIVWSRYCSRCGADLGRAATPESSQK